MKKIILGNICKLRNGYAFKSGDFINDGIPLVRIGDISNENIDLKNSVKVKEKDIFNNYLIGKGSILIAMSGATTGKIGIFKHDIKAYQNQRVGCFLPDLKELNNEYLYFFTKTMRDEILQKAYGGAQPNISPKDIENIEIPLPPLDEQKRIAAVLTRAEKLIAKRKESIGLLDEFLKSTFLEMFGNPVRNEKGWEKQELFEILSKIESGKSPVCLDRSIEYGEWGVLKLGAVTKCVYYPDENKALPENEKPNPDIEINKGDVLFTRKNTYELVAACAYVWDTPPNLMMSDLIFRLVPKDLKIINPIFLQGLMSSSSQRKAVQSLAGGAAGSMPNISKTNLMKFKVILPPLDLQNQFAAIVEKVEVLKAKYAASLAGLENLYGSLSQRAFKGELDLVVRV